MKRSLLDAIEVGSFGVSAMFLGAMSVRGEAWLAAWGFIATLLIAWLVIWELWSARRRSITVASGSRPAHRDR